jgi:hypothetical protein
MKKEMAKAVVSGKTEEVMADDWKLSCRLDYESGETPVCEACE